MRSRTARKAERVTTRATAASCEESRDRTRPRWRYPAELLAQLADVLEVHEGGGEPIDDPDSALEDEFDLDADDLEAVSL